MSRNSPAPEAALSVPTTVEFGAQDGTGAAWLAAVCARVEGVRCAVVLEVPRDGDTLSPLAIWPESTHDIAYLRPACDAAVRPPRPIKLVLPRIDSEGSSHAVIIAQPLEHGGRLRWLIAMDLGHPSSGSAEAALKQITETGGWLVAARLLAEQQGQRSIVERLTFLTNAIALAGEERNFHQSALNIVNEVARRFNCERASLGIERANFIEVVAVSNKASFDARATEIRLLADAMDETLDQAYPIIHPGPDPNALPVPAHAVLAAHTGAITLCSIPLRVRGRAIGVLTLERHAGELFVPDSHDLLAAFGDVLGTLVELKKDADRGAFTRLRDTLSDGCNALFGPRHPGVKFGAILALSVLGFLSVASGDYRVAAKTVVEGAVQRAIVVPFDGFLAESAVRAGDVVKAGQLLCRLDDKDLNLEKAKWEAEAAQLLPKYRAALATHDAGMRKVLGAQIAQAEIELKLVEERLTRATITAPFAGVVVSGDLSQLLGTPIEKGKVLFEVAPLDEYRVILKVDERDIAAVRTTQQGELAVAGLPDARLPFKVKQITPVASAEEGQNFFRVEAQMESESGILRPGMQGVGKIFIGERKLLWIWAHRLLEWITLSLWKWLP